MNISTHRHLLVVKDNKSMIIYGLSPLIQRYIMYNNCKILGPYKGKKDGRWRVVIKINGKWRTVSYPKYLMEVKLNRYLLSNETVDHIDKNVDNNDYDNLRILSREEHCRIDNTKYEITEFVCPVCNKSFTLNGLQISRLCTERNRNIRSGPFCSRRCRGIYSRKVQMKLIPKNIVKELKINKYKK